MKPFLPCLTLGLVFLGACGLEKPPASLKFPEEKKEAAAPAAAAPAAPAAAPVAEKAPADPKLAAGKAVVRAIRRKHFWLWLLSGLLWCASGWCIARRSKIT